MISTLSKFSIVSISILIAKPSLAHHCLVLLHLFVLLLVLLPLELLPLELIPLVLLTLVLLPLILLPLILLALRVVCSASAIDGFGRGLISFFRLRVHVSVLNRCARLVQAGSLESVRGSSIRRRSRRAPQMLSCWPVHSGTPNLCPAPRRVLEYQGLACFPVHFPS